MLSWCCAVLCQSCVWCEKPCTRKIGRSLIHRHCNNERIAEQRTSASHAKRVLSDEAASLILSPPPPTKRARTDEGDREPVATAANALLTFHTRSVHCMLCGFTCLVDTHSRVACACVLCCYLPTDARRLPLLLSHQSLGLPLFLLSRP